MTGFEWSERDGVGTLSAAGRVLARYDHSNRKNHPHFRDLRPLQHDGSLTTTAPWDHRWHHGLWWSWKFIDGVLYWEDHPGYGNGDGRLGRSRVTAHDAEENDRGVEVRELLDWTPEGSTDAVLTEQRTLTIHDDLGGLAAWAIDWDQTWTAQKDVPLTVTPYPEHWWGGYAGLNYRAARSMAAGETILAAGGRTGREAVHAEEGTWAALVGNVDGSGEDSPDEPARGGVALLVHPSSAPLPFYVFSAVDEFGFLATAPLLRAPRQLAEGQTLRLRQRAIVLGADLAHHDLEELARRYGEDTTTN